MLIELFFSYRLRRELDLRQETIAGQQLRICELESTLDQHGTISNTSDNLAKSTVEQPSNDESSVIVDLKHQIQALMVNRDCQTLRRFKMFV